MDTDETAGFALGGAGLVEHGIGLGPFGGMAVYRTVVLFRLTLA